MAISCSDVNGEVAEDVQDQTPRFLNLCISVSKSFILPRCRAKKKKERKAESWLIT